MKRTTQIVAATLVAVLTLSGLSVLAAEEQAAPAKGNKPFFAGMYNKAKGWGNRQGWGRKELTEEQKAAHIEAAKAALSSRLESGKISQEQYNEQLAKIEAGDFGFQFKGRDNAENGKEQNAEKSQRKELTEQEKTAQLETYKAVLEAQLKSGKITQEQYDQMLAKRQSGTFGPQFGNRESTKPQWNRGEKKELTEEEKAARIEEQKAALAAKLAEGKLTQEQYDNMLAKIQAGDFGSRFHGWGGNRDFQNKKPQWNREENSEKKWEGKPNFGGFQRGWGKGPQTPKPDSTETPATN